jgi:hypothetical protein
VGDLLQLDTRGDGTLDSILSVHRRISATELELRTLRGEPYEPAHDAIQEWSLIRAYTSLADALRGPGFENQGIAANLRGFDAWLADRDLPAVGKRLKIACYADSVDASPVVVDGWVTSRDYPLTIFVPTEPNEVGAPQRHLGSWTDSGFSVRVTDTAAIDIYSSYVSLHGIQVESASNETGSGRFGIRSRPECDAGGTARVRISHSIVRGVFGGTAEPSAAMAFGGPDSCAGATHEAWNNVAFGFSYGSNETGRACFSMSTGAHVLAHNTAYDCRLGFVADSGSGDERLHNNLSAASLSGGTDYLYIGYNDGFAQGYAGNLSTDDTSPNPELHNLSVPFRNPAAGDFHLASGANPAVDAGASSRELEIEVVDDIDLQPRLGRPDIGADERY